jgi:hypothetical protein
MNEMMEEVKSEFCHGNEMLEEVKCEFCHGNEMLQELNYKFCRIDFCCSCIYLAKAGDDMKVTGNE